MGFQWTISLPTLFGVLRLNIAQSFFHIFVEVEFSTQSVIPMSRENLHDSPRWGNAPQITKMIYHKVKNLGLFVLEFDS